MLFFKIGTYAGTMNKIVLTIGLAIGFLFGGWTELLTALIILQALDIIMGLLTATQKRSVNSSIMYTGIKKKLATWIGLILAHVIDKVLFDNQPIALTGLAFVMISNEGLSITENMGILGVPLPDFITGYLEQIRNQEDIAEIKSDEMPAREIDRVIIEDEDGVFQQLVSRDADILKDGKKYFNQREGDK